MKHVHIGRLARVLVYLVVVVLVNLAAVTLFFRVDLTADKIYSLSEASKKAVATLSEPLTIKVFFTRNLPAPYNGTERYLRDLLGEYGIFANRHFNYAFYDVSPDTGTGADGAGAEGDEARNYGIYPVQIQHVEQDELKFRNAYMGLVVIHGDVVEAIPAIISTDGLEYKITTTITKLNNKISALLALSEPIEVTVYLSSSLEVVAPYMGVKEIAGVPATLEHMINTLNTTHYGKLSFRFSDPARDGSEEDVAKRYNLMLLRWPDVPDRKISKGQGVIGCVVAHGGRAIDVPLLDVVRLPLLGTRYELIDTERLKETVNAAVESLIGINQTMGFLADHGTLDMSGRPTMGQFDDGTSDLAVFRNLVSQNYSLKEVNIAEGPVLERFKSMIIARPTEPFSEYELYCIDQMLMKGTNVAVFLDAFEEETPSSRNPFGSGGTPAYVAIDTGLEKLLNHYGVSMRHAYVMDESCYRQEVPKQLGGGEQPIYFAPIIKKEFIGQEPGFMKNIKGIVIPKAAPLDIDEGSLNAKGIKAYRVLASSDRSWEVKENITLHPLFIAPPREEAEFGSRPLAYILEGRFASYFAGKPVPERPMASAIEPSASPSSAVSPAAVGETGEPLTKSLPVKLFVIASSEILKNNVLDEEGRSTNAMFVMNLIDYLNDRNDMVALRSKEQRFNPLHETDALVKTGIKTFNIAVLPVLVVVAGLVVWLRRLARRKNIEAQFPESRG